MKSVCIFFILLIAMDASIASTPERKILLGTNVSSAYTAGRGQLMRSGSIEHIECIFNRLQQPYDITSKPWLRARQDVRKGDLDGFFTALSIDGADDYASLSAPLVLENWYWFWRADMPAPASWKENTRLGVIRGSQQAEWLEHAGYAKPMVTNNLPQMLKLLFSKRIDVILADKEHFDLAAKELGIKESAYQFRFFRYVPLGVYFNNTFLKQQPHFLTRFNQHIYSCAPEGFQISHYERDNITRLIKPLAQQWVALPEVITAVTAQNHHDVELKEILDKDLRWQREFNTGKFSLAAAMMGIPLSQKLLQLQRQTQGLVTEIILMDAKGANVAISNITSDYWQGDEAKYLLSFNKPPGNLLFERVRYDESTRRFQINVSLPVYGVERETSIGVMTIGVDVEQALSLKQ